MIVLNRAKTVFREHDLNKPVHPIFLVKKLGPYARRKKRERESGAGWTKTEWLAHLSKHGNKCLCCSAVGLLLVPDHVIPMRRGGKHDLSNIQPLCLKCNFRKGLRIVDYRNAA